jgi:glycosyltransferase involved in cell wall biosynthesis
MSDFSKPLVTIGIPTYNRARDYLRETLESALAQTYPRLEIVVSNNCSTDDTDAVVRAYADPRLRYIKQQKALLPNDHFNFCLNEARGDYFLLLHDDDKIDPDFVESCLQAAHFRTDCGAILAGVRIIDQDGRTLTEVPNRADLPAAGDLFLAWMDGRLSLYVCSTLYNTQTLKDVGGFHSRHNMFQDVAATARVIAHHGRVDVRDVKASARQHQGKWTHTVRVREWCEDSRDLLDLLCELAPDKALLLRERGTRFFANINYRRASDVGPLAKKLSAYAFVYRFFEGRYLPPPRMVFQSTGLYRGLRQIKRAVLGRTPRIA